MNGILNVNKPQGKTSFSVVSMIKRLSGERRVGHAGTLDPQATGVLPVCLGQATRVVEFLHEHSKTYRAEIELGVDTDTYDAWGEVTQRHDPTGISRDDVLSALGSFKGLIRQTPPMYSAIKQQGKPLYQLARAGATVERKSRQATICGIQLLDWKPPLFTMDIVCGKGTYIRSLAHDLGQSLGCGAILKSLFRLKYGPFELGDALSIAQLEDAFHNGYWVDFVYPLDAVLLDYEAVVVTDDEERAVRNGVPLDFHAAGIHQPSGNRLRIYTGEGCFLGVLDFNAGTGKWQPLKVFNTV